MKKKFINEVTISAKKGNVTFETADINTPYVQKIIDEIAKRSNKPRDEVLKEIEEEHEQFKQNIQGPDRMFAVQRQNSIESVIFNKLTPTDADKLDERTFNYMFKAIIAKNKTFLKIEDRITGKKVKFNVILTPQPAFVKQPDWVKSVGTAAASPEGDVVFNKAFASKLIAYASAKGIKAKGSMYVSNGGTVPDSYAYIEFLILHEIYHIIHADHFQQSRTEGMTGKMQNYLGDFITNYNLVKAGYAQLPIGLFSNDYNFDKFKTMVDMQKAIIEDFNELNKNQQDQMDDQMDDHMDKDHQPSNKQQSGQQDKQQQQQNQPQDGQDNKEQSQDNQEQGDGQGGDSQDKQDKQDGEKSDGKGDGKGEKGDESEEKSDSNKGDGKDSEKSDEKGDDESQGKGEGDDSQKSDDGQEQSDSGDSKGKPSDGESGKPSDQKSSSGDNDKSLEDSFKNADESMEGADDGMTQEELDRKIKEAESEKNAESDRMRQEKLDNLEKERERREQTMKELNDKIDGARPVDWKKLIKSMIPKEKEVEEESLTRMHRRTVGQLALGADKVSIKAGTIKGASPTQSLLFILDSSGSMGSVIDTISTELLRLIDKNKTFGIHNMYIIRFDSTYDVYKVKLDMKGSKHTYQPLANPLDIINSKKESDVKLKGTEKPIKELFQMRWGAGTEFPDAIFRIIKELLDQDFNQVIFSDTDIIWGDNIVNLARACKLGMKKAYSFNVILDSERSYQSVKKALGGTYKYMSYLGDV
mgnify:CR=1 FL=1